MARKKLKVKQKYSFMIPWLYTVVESYKVFDIETTGLNPRIDKIFSYCIGHWDGSVDVYRLDHKSKKINRRNWKILVKFFEDTSISKIAHNYKFELGFLKSHGINVPEETVWHDTMLMSQLLRNLAPSHALDFLGWELFGYTRTRDKKVKQLGNQLGGYHLIPEPLMHPYQIDDGIRPMVLFQLWHHLFTSNPALNNDYINELQLVRTTQRLESYGMCVDVKNARALLKETRIKFRQTQEDTRKYLGEYFNLNSDKQLVPLLYERMGFPILKLTKNKNPSTDKDTLFELKEMYPDEEIFDLIFKWRTYRNGLSIIQSYIDLCDEDFVIHPNIKTNIARTGRESSENPNLHNVAKAGVHKNEFALPARECFRSRYKHTLIFIDYSGIEMRIIVELTQEPELVKMVFEGKDLHALAAEIFFGELFTNKNKCLREYLPTKRDLWRDFKKACKRNPHEIENIKDEFFAKCKKLLRGAAKNGQFALAYGASLSKIALTLKIDEDVLRPGFEKYCERFPRVASFSHDMASQGKECGYVETPFGRRLYASRDKLYSLSNYKVQGTAAGILKRAQVRVDHYLMTCWDDKVRIVLPIHDEIVLEMPDELLPFKNLILEDIITIMTTMPEINIPLEAECKETQTNWNEAVEYKMAA